MIEKIINYRLTTLTKEEQSDFMATAWPNGKNGTVLFSRMKIHGVKTFTVPMLCALNRVGVNISELSDSDINTAEGIYAVLAGCGVQEYEAEIEHDQESSKFFVILLAKKFEPILGELGIIVRERKV